MRQLSTFLLLFVLLGGAARAQQPEQLLFPTLDQQEPTLYGDGVLQLLAQGDAEVQRSQFLESIRTFSAAVALAPNLAEPYVRRAKVYRLTGELEEAQEDIRRAMQLDPLVVDVFAYGNPARRATVLALQVDSSLLLSDRATILASYRRYVNQRTVAFAADLAAPSTFGEDEELAAWTPDRLDRALQHVLDNQPRQALEILAAWPAADGEAGLAYSLAGYLESLEGHPDYAESYWFMAAEADPDLPFPYYHLGRQALVFYHPETTVQLLRESLARDQAFVPARQDLMAVEGQHADQPDPQSWSDELSVYRSATAHLNRSLAYFRAGDYGNALADANQAIQQADAPDAGLYAWRGGILLLTDQPQAAERDFTSALTKGGRSAAVLQNRGLARILGKNRGAGCSDLAESAQMDNLSARQLWVSLCQF